MNEGNKLDVRKSTGFRCYRDELFVGDLLSVQSGYGGFVRVIERDSGFWLVDWESEKGDFSRVPTEERIPDTPLDEDIAAPYRKVDPNDPYREPPFPIYQTAAVKPLTLAMGI